MKAKDINGSLSNLYKNYKRVFEDIGKFSIDYSYPTFINCTDDYAQDNTRLLCVEWESSLWYRNRNNDSDHIAKYYEKNAPWVYKHPDVESTDTFMEMYCAFNKMKMNYDNPKEKFWGLSKSIESALKGSMLFTYFMKSDVNIGNNDKFDLKYQQSKYKMFEMENLRILSEEIKILDPTHIFFFSGSRLGKGEFSLRQILNEDFYLKPVAEVKDVLYIDQHSFPKTEMFLMPSLFQLKKTNYDIMDKIKLLK